MKKAALSLLLLASACALGPARDDRLARIDTIVVIYAENHSFDNMYGLFPGADGVADASAGAKTQVDHDGKPLPTLPPVYVGGKASDQYPKGLPNGPFRIDQPPVARTFSDIVPSPIHAYWQNIEQIDGGRNDRFVAMTTVGAWTMGYYDGSSLRMWQWAKRYTLADHFFMGAFGGSFLNHHWLVCACTPVFPDAREAIRAQLDADGRLKRRASSPASVMDGPVQLFDGQVTPDGFAVNTSQPAYQPSGAPPAPHGDFTLADPARDAMPPQEQKTIGDTLSAKSVSWAWYAGGWNAAVADGVRDPAAKREVIYSNRPGTPSFQPHHQPFNYYRRFAPGSAERAEHLKDGEDFLAAIDQGTLPRVAFYKPVGRLTQHPSYTDIQSGDVHIAELLERLEKSPQWPRMLVVVTYDENGGYWDHVAPPMGAGWGDRWGPATRVPTLIVGPTVKRGFVDHTSYDTTSILKLITRRFGLEPLPGVRANAGDLTNALE
jgi:acid phosphatase